MSANLYFPRLQRDAARSLLSEYSSLTIGELQGRSALEFSQAYWYPTAPAGQQASPDVLAEFQGTIRGIAKNHGYPTVLSDKNPERVKFDREVVSRILSVAPILPAEAAAEPVWSYLSLVVLPDVALWRWPNTKEKDDYERILGYPRNVFRRLWWRAFTLGAAPGDVGPLVLEDEAVAILERTTIGGSRTLARVIAETHVGRYEKAPKRTDLMRDAMKRIRRLHAFVSFHSLSESEVRALVEEAFDEAAALLLDPMK